MLDPYSRASLAAARVMRAKQANEARIRQQASFHDLAPISARSQSDLHPRTISHRPPTPHDLHTLSPPSTFGVVESHLTISPSTPSKLHFPSSFVKVGSQFPPLPLTHLNLPTSILLAPSPTGEQ